MDQGICSGGADSLVFHLLPYIALLPAAELFTELFHSSKGFLFVCLFVRLFVFFCFSLYLFVVFLLSVVISSHCLHATTLFESIA